MSEHRYNTRDIPPSLADFLMQLEDEATGGNSWTGDEQEIGWFVARQMFARYFVDEGWWHPNVKAGAVHLHPARDGRAELTAYHRLCQPVYTRKP